MKHSTAQHSTAQHSTAKLKASFSLFRSLRFSRSFLWIASGFFFLLFCNHLFAFQLVSVSPSAGSGNQAQTFRITFDQPARLHGIGGNSIPPSEFTHPYITGLVLVFEAIPINGSMQGGVTYASEWEFTIPESVMATWKARSNTATTQLQINLADFVDAAGGQFQGSNHLLHHTFTFLDNTSDPTAVQAATAQTRLASQLGTQTVRTTSNRLHSLRRERHAKRRSGSRNKPDTQNRFTQGLKVRFSNPDIDHLVRRAVIANQLKCRTDRRYLAALS